MPEIGKVLEEILEDDESVGYNYQRDAQYQMAWPFWMAEI
jgi:hypothetical protein